VQCCAAMSKSMFGHRRGEGPWRRHGVVVPVALLLLGSPSLASLSSLAWCWTTASSFCGGRPPPSSALLLPFLPLPSVWRRRLGDMPQGRSRVWLRRPGLYRGAAQGLPLAWMPRIAGPTRGCTRRRVVPIQPLRARVRVSGARAGGFHALSRSWGKGEGQVGQSSASDKGSARRR